MRRVAGALLALGLLSAFAVPVAAADEPSTATADELGLEAVDESTPGAVVAIEEQPDGALEVVRYAVPSSVDVDAAVAALESDPNVVSAELDGAWAAIEPVAPSGGALPAAPDPGRSQQWHLDRIHAPQTWNRNGTGATLAVLDTGVDAAHADLAGQILPGWDFLTDQPTSVDTGGHGTFVAGMATAIPDNGIGIAATVRGLSILPGTVCAQLCPWSDIAEGIIWATNQGVDAINLSIAGPSGSAIVATAVDYARSHGVPVIAAAGNEGETTIPPFGLNPRNYPAAIPGVIGVGATTSSNSATTWASFGDYVDLAAPGDDVVSTYPGGYAFWSGTSFSSPQVAAATVLAHHLDPSLTPDELEAMLEQSAADVHTAGWDERTGAGLLDMAAFIDLVVTGTVATTTTTTTTTAPTTTIAPTSTIPPLNQTPPTRAEAPAFTPINPTRLADTRIGLAGGRIPASGTLMVPINGKAGLPTDSTAVAANITAVGAASAGFLTVWPCGQPMPNASTVNYQRGGVDPNAAFAGLGNGALCVYSSAEVDVIVDVAGVFRGTQASYEPVVPARLVDTRLDGRRMRQDSVLRVGVRSHGVSAAASVVTLNVTAVEPATGGYLTVWPCDAPLPNASNLNTAPGVTRPNLVTVGIATGGDICIYSSADTDLIVDVNGWWGPGATSVYSPVVPTRVVDTRIDHGATRMGAGAMIAIPIVGRSGVPTDASAVAVNVTAVDAAGAGFITVWPCGILPTASNVNFALHATVPNAAAVGLSGDGKLCVYTSAETELIVDITGYWR